MRTALAALAGAISVSVIQPAPGQVVGARDVPSQVAGDWWPGRRRHAPRRDPVFNAAISEANGSLRRQSPQALVELLEQRLVDGFGDTAPRWSRDPRNAACIAAVRLLGDGGHSARLEQQYRIWKSYNAPIPGFFVTRMLEEIAEAWYGAELASMTPEQAISAIRDEWSIHRLGTVRRHAHVLLFDRELDRRGWGPDIKGLLDDPDPRVRRSALSKVPMRDPDLPEEIRDRLVEAIVDPAEEVRSFAGPRLSVVPIGPQIWGPALARFVLRPDISTKARNVAVRALEIRGHRVSQQDGEWNIELVPPSDDRPDPRLSGPHRR